MKKFALLFAVIALVVGTAAAQNGAFAPYATVGVGVQAGGIDLTNKTNPNYSFGGGIESSTKYFLLDAHTTYNTAANNIGGNIIGNLKTGGYTLNTQASGYLKLANHILAGAGVDSSINNVNYKYQSVTEFTQSFQGVHPFVGVGFQTSKFRVIGNYLLPGKDAFTNERIVNITGEIFLAKHIRLTANTQLNSYVPAEIPVGRQMKVAVGAGLKFVL